MIHFYDDHQSLVSQIPVGFMKDVEHWKVYENAQHRGDYSVIVCKGGLCFVGKARRNLIDSYSRRVGYGLSLRRALIKVVKHLKGRAFPDFLISDELVGRESKKACQTMTSSLGL